MLSEITGVKSALMQSQKSTCSPKESQAAEALRLRLQADPGSMALVSFGLSPSLISFKRKLPAGMIATFEHLLHLSDVVTDRWREGQQPAGYRSVPFEHWEGGESSRTSTGILRR